MTDLPEAGPAAGAARPPRIEDWTADTARTRADALVEVLVDCVDGGASVGFLGPLATAEARAFWWRIADAVAAGQRRLLVAVDEQGRVAGTVQLVLDLPPNQPHRAEVAKMLVHRRARRRGVGAALLAAVETAAATAGRRTLVLDTVTGGDAERLYHRAGWTTVGRIPDYALMPDGRPAATTVFYKPLAVPAR